MYMLLCVVQINCAVICYGGFFARAICIVKMTEHRLCLFSQVLHQDMDLYRKVAAK